MNKKWVHKPHIYPQQAQINYEFKNLHAAALEIIQSINNKEKICVFADYDVDGISAASIMYKALLPLIKENLEIYIPNRQEGYGLNMAFIEKTKADLVITVDNGITAIEQTKRIKELGKKIIVTDHHTPQDTLPDCLIVNPKICNNEYIKDICGTAVAWYLCDEIYKILGLSLESMYAMADIVALATIADLVPMKNANKDITNYGLKLMEQFKFSSEGLMYIVKNKVKLQYGIEAEDIGFGVAPVFNAIGRLEDPNVAFQILAQNKLDLIPYALNLNENRKTLQNEKFITSISEADTSKNFIIYVDDTIEKGMIGLVAGDLCNRFNKPTIVISNGHGSGRSVNGVSIFDIVKQAEEYLNGWGGHVQALGLNMKKENVELFKQKIYELTKDLVIEPIVEYHDEISILNHQQILNFIKTIKPFGQENPEPKWLIRDLKIYEQKIIGKYKNVLMMNLSGKKSFMFKTFDLIPKNTIDVVCTIKRDGSLQIEDWK